MDHISSRSNLVLHVFLDTYSVEILFSDPQLASSDQTNLFLSKLQRLLNIINTLDAQNKNTVQEKANDLLKRVKNERNLNAGGKFEWVDSVLIKV